MNSLLAESTWYVIDGYSTRINENPLDISNNFIYYHIELDNYKFKFYRSKLSDRWWVEFINDQVISIEKDKFGNKKFDSNFKKISFKNIFFAYKDEDWVLKDFNLEIDNGDSILLLGSTGSGKTTILNLLSFVLYVLQGTNYSRRDQVILLVCFLPKKLS